MQVGEEVLLTEAFFLDDLNLPMEDYEQGQWDK